MLKVNYVCVYGGKYESMYERWFPWKEKSEPVELELRAASHLIQVLGSKLGPSTRALFTLNSPGTI